METWKSQGIKNLIKMLEKSGKYQGILLLVLVKHLTAYLFLVNICFLFVFRALGFQ